MSSESYHPSGDPKTDRHLMLPIVKVTCPTQAGHERSEHVVKLGSGDRMNFFVSP